jgi:uncharacterized protein
VAQVAEDLIVSRLRGVVHLTRTPQGVYTEARLQAVVSAECVRCLTQTDCPLRSRIAELYYYPPETAPEGALSVGEDLNLDLAPVVREDMLISMPMRLLCRPDCKGLCPRCGQNWNDGPCGCRDEAIDPRLAVLSQLLKEAPDQ